MINSTLKNYQAALILGITLSTLVVEKPTQATTIHTNSGNGNKYFLTRSGSWFEARNEAFSKLGTGNLVKIDDQSEQTWLNRKFLNNSITDAWIGLNDAQQEGIWRWEDGTTANYENWYYVSDDWREPNNKWGNEDYVLMGRDGKWNDFLGAGTNPDGGNAFFPGIAEINPLDTPASGGTASLVFQANGDWRIPGGWDHAALNLNGWIYESTPPFVNIPTSYYDQKLGVNVVVEKEDGVQNQRTIEVLKKWKDHKNLSEVPISASLARGMAAKITTVLGAGYEHTPFYDPIYKFRFRAENQKGKDGLFGCAGLLEWASEQVNQNQGFIPNTREYINIGPLQHISTVTPTLLHDAVLNPSRYSKSTNWLGILTDPVDFILTDPNGRRLGYTSDLGFLNEIPDSFYTGDDWAEQAYIPDLLSGEYILELFGLGEHAAVSLGNSDNGVLFDDFLAKGERRTLTFTVPGSSAAVPEPSSLLGLLAASFGLGVLKRQKQRAKTKELGI